MLKKGDDPGACNSRHGRSQAAKQHGTFEIRRFLRVGALDEPAANGKTTAGREVSSCHNSKLERPRWSGGSVAHLADQPCLVVLCRSPPLLINTSPPSAMAPAAVTETCQDCLQQSEHFSPTPHKAGHMLEGARRILSHTTSSS